MAQRLRGQPAIAVVDGCGRHSPFEFDEAAVRTGAGTVAVPVEDLGSHAASPAAGKQAQAPTDVYAPITEAILGNTTTEQTFRAMNVGTIKMTDIKGIKY